MGLAFASSLFLGCEQFMGEKSPEKNLENNPPADVALQLSVKQTDECKALRDRVLAARNGGEATGDLEAGFIRNCIDEVKPVDGRRDTILPPNLVPDPRTRCHWIVAQIDGGHDELIIKFKYWCPDDCDTLARTDSAGHLKYCRDPKPDCEELRRKLANMDPKSEEYARLKRFLDGNCGVKPPIDTIIRPKPVGYCDSLRHLLVLGFLDSVSLDRVHRQLAEKCGRDTIHPPKPIVNCDSLRRLMNSGTLSSEDSARIGRQMREWCGLQPPCDTIRPPKPISYCDSLHRLLASGTLDSATLSRIKHEFMEKCQRDTILPPKPILNCDSLRRLMHSGTLSTEDSIRVSIILREKCGVKPPIDTILPPKPIGFCDSLHRLLASGTLSSEDSIRVSNLLREKCITPVPLTCSQMKDQLSKLDPASAEYARLKTLFSQKCLLIEPPLSDCEAYRAKLANLDPNSADYARLKALVAEKCALIQPVR